MEVTGKRAVEDAAIAWVCELERKAGRIPKDMRGSNSPVDILSPPRSIEVKAYGRFARGEELFIEVAQFEEAERNPELFQLKVLAGQDLRSLLDRAKEQRYFTMPWPVAHYDSLDPGPR